MMYAKGAPCLCGGRIFTATGIFFLLLLLLPSSSSTSAVPDARFTGKIALERLTKQPCLCQLSVLKWNGLAFYKRRVNIMFYCLKCYLVLIRIHYRTFYWFCAVLDRGYELRMKFLLSLLKKLFISLIKNRWLFLRLKVQSLFMLHGPRHRRSNSKFRRSCKVKHYRELSGFKWQWLIVELQVLNTCG